MAPLHAQRGRRNGRRDARARKKIYEASRVQDLEEESELSKPNNDETADVTSDAEDISSDGDDMTTQKQNAYAALLQSFGKVVQDDETRRKRRKLTSSNDGQKDNDDVFSNRNADDTSGVSKQHDQTVAEDLEEQGADEEEEISADEDEDALDAFDVHFANPDQNELSQRLKAITQKQWYLHNFPGSLGDKWTLALPGASDKAVATNDGDSSRYFPDASSFKFKQRLSSEAPKIINGLSSTEQTFASSVLGYRDTLFPARTVSNSSALRDTTCLHILNHVFKTRDRVIKNNARLAKDDTLEFADQGFTRPKVLILLPTRQSCVRYIASILRVCQPEQQENRKRFEQSYVADEAMEMERPDDYKELFAGNNDDMFRIGIKFTRKTMKLFAQFYNSDIIIASPLGLRQAISGKKADSDFLSSIEIMVLDQADALLMQNWDHVIHCFEHLNQQPKEAHGCDFSRVRSWYLDGHARYLRQTIILSAYIAPQHLALVDAHTSNVGGRVFYQPFYAGAILTPQSLGTKQTFLRFASPNLPDDPTARFKYFTSAILPTIAKVPRNADGSGLGLLIYVPDSLDFPRLRNHLSFHNSCANISFGVVDENHEPATKEVRRARSHFATGRHSVMLYTERAHHFFRYRLKGVKRVVFYGVPTNPIYYEEVTALLDHVDEGAGDVRCLFSKWERLALERIVGSERVRKMIRDKGGDTFEFL